MTMVSTDFSVTEWEAEAMEWYVPENNCQPTTGYFKNYFQNEGERKDIFR